jgi:site-specific DNA-methyltransferase (adenine-specific)
MVTSPPYFNAPFDYEGFFKSYDTFLTMIEKFATETYRVLQEGRVAVVNVDDMLINGEKYPISADTIKIFQKSGFRYRDKIVWKKPDGYLRISKRSGVLLQNPFPMYFYPDNLLESILIFQKGKFDYRNIKKEIKEKSRVDKEEFQKNKWYMTLWEMTNVLPGSRLEKNIAAFPDELPYRFIKLFSYKGEIILDPFLGSGTTMKVARKLERNSIGFEINRDLETVIREKAGFINADNIKEGDTFEVSERSEGKYRYINYEIIEEIKNKNN